MKNDTKEFYLPEPKQKSHHIFWNAVLIIIIWRNPQNSHSAPGYSYHILLEFRDV